MSKDAEQKKTQVEQLTEIEKKVAEVLQDMTSTQIAKQEDVKQVINDLQRSLAAEWITQINIDTQSAEAKDFIRDYQAHVMPLLREFEKYQEGSVKIEAISKALITCLQKVYETHIPLLKKFKNYQTNIASQMITMKAQVELLHTESNELRAIIRRENSIAPLKAENYTNSVLSTLEKMLALAKFLLQEADHV